MKSNLKKLLSLCLVLVMVMALLPVTAAAYWDENDEWVEEEIPNAYFYLDEYHIDLHLGDTYQIVPHIYYPEDITPTYDVEPGSNYGNVTVDANGLITATEIGEARVFVTVGNCTASLIVTILDEIPNPEDISTPMNSISILWEEYIAETDEFVVRDTEEIHVSWETEYEYLMLFARKGGSDDKLVWDYELSGDPFGCYLMHNRMEWEHSSNGGNFCDLHVYNLDGDYGVIYQAPKNPVVLTVTVTTSTGAADSVDIVFDPPQGAVDVYEIVEKRAICSEDGGFFAVSGGIEYPLYTRPSEMALGCDKVLTEHVDPSETEEGYNEYTCSRCGTVYTETIPATGPQECPSKNFVDVPGESNWAHAGIDYVVSKGLMNGIDATHFAPADDVTRAMLVTILWANEGKPAVTTDKKFSDVPANKWYAGAVAWAAENGIVSGRSATTFAPDDAVTRQDLALILKKYAEFKGISGAAAGSLDAFADKGSVSKYAQNAVAWAVANGIISGSNEGGKLYLNPADSATRGQTAAILMKFFENVK